MDSLTRVISFSGKQCGKGGVVGFSFAFCPRLTRCHSFTSRRLGGAVSTPLRVGGRPRRRCGMNEVLTKTKPMGLACVYTPVGLHTGTAEVQTSTHRYTTRAPTIIGLISYTWGTAAGSYYVAAMISQPANKRNQYW